VRVLIVEDEPLIAWMLADCLEGAGHEVVGPAASMAEALALCEGPAAPPELAVLDIGLRDGSSGAELARALLVRWGVRSIFASAQTEDARRARDAALGCVRKPYAPETVLRCVEVAREVMGGGQPRAVPAGFELFAAVE
jgi:DNA-binding response OmpR family regulator